MFRAYKNLTKYAFLTINLKDKETIIFQILHPEFIVIFIILSEGRSFQESTVKTQNQS